MSIEIERNGTPVARIVIEGDADSPTVAFETAGIRGLSMEEGRHAVDRLLEELGDHARAVSLDIGDVALRAAARAAGFVGPLRAPLRWAASESGSTRDEQLARLLPGDAISRRRSRLARFRSGMGDMTTLEARRRRALVSVRAPWDDDTLVEALAAAVDTALTMVERFPVLARTRIDFALSDTKMLENQVAGYSTDRAVALHAGYVAGPLHDRLISGGGGARRWSSQPAGRSWAVDAVTIHELGHQLDSAARIASSRTEFRTRIGHALGVPSVECALRGLEPDAPREWRVAHARLVDWVSDYGATSPIELFAELTVAVTETANPVTDEFLAFLTERYPAPPDVPAWPA